MEQRDFDTSLTDTRLGDEAMISVGRTWRRSRWTGLVWLATFIATFLHPVISRVQGPCRLFSEGNTKCSGQDLLWIVFDILALFVGIPLLLVIGGLLFSSLTEKHRPSSTLDNVAAAAIGLFSISLLVFVPSVLLTADDDSGSTVNLMVAAFVTVIASGVAIWVLAGRRTGTSGRS